MLYNIFSNFVHDSKFYDTGFSTCVMLTPKEFQILKYFRMFDL